MQKLILAIFLLVGVSGRVAAQSEGDLDSTYYEQNYESGEQKIRGGWGFNMQISTDGFVLGGLYNYKLAKYTFFGVSLDMFWVRGKDEQQAIDPVTGFPVTINSETILILPLQFNLKRRILGESISNTLRPFVIASAGAVQAWYLDGQKPTGGLPSDHDDSQIAATASAGFGADFGKPGQSAYGVDLKYQFLRFQNHLGLRKNFDNFQLGFHMNF